jgi:hypothetical protein
MRQPQILSKFFLLKKTLSGEVSQVYQYTGNLQASQGFFGGKRRAGRKD